MTKSWPTKKLGGVADIIMGQSPPSSSYNERGEGLPFFQGKAEFGEIYPPPVKYCSAPSRIAEANDVLMSVRAPVGNINLAKEKSCVGRGLGALRAKNNILNQMFLFYFMKKNESNWSRLSTGSTFSAISGEVSQGLIYKSELFITEKGLKESSAKIFPINTILVAMYGATTGQIGLLKFETSTNQAICGIFPNDKFVPEYLYYFLKTKTKYLIKISAGGAQPNISQTVIRNLKVPLPDVKTQKQIVAKLSAVQDYKKQLLEQKAKLEELFDSALARSMNSRQAESMN